MSETATKQVVSAAALRAQSRHTITNPQTGNTFVIRDVWTRDLYKSAAIPSPPAESPMPGTNRINPEELRAFEIALLVHGVVEPRIVDGDGDESSVGASELNRSDREFLLAQIVEVSGLVPETFREETGP